MGDARERLAGSMRGWLGQFGSVTNIFLWTTVAVFALQLVGALFRWNVMEDLFALDAAQVRRGFVWQPLTYMFLHDVRDPFHIIFNLLILWFFGREVEYFIGPKFFTRLYLLGGLAGGAIWFTANFSGGGYLLGASAAVLACVIAFATLFPDRQVIVLIFPVPGRLLALIVIVIDVIPLIARSGGSVAHLAHLGGAAFGYLYVKQLGYGATPFWLRAWQQLKDRLWPRRRDRAERKLSREEFIQQQVDPILDKISREGMQSLTRRERKILESAKELMQKQQR